MSEKAIIQKIEHLETMIVQLNDKIDNFLGLEEVSDQEREEIDQLQQGISNGEYVSLDDL